MNEERLNELFSIVNEGYSSIQEREIRDYITNLQQENKQLKDKWKKLKEDLQLVVEYGIGDEGSKWDKIYGECAKSTLKFMQELEQGNDNNE